MLSSRMIKIYGDKYKNSTQLWLGEVIVKELIQNSLEETIWSNGNFLHHDQGITFVWYMFLQNFSKNFFKTSQNSLKYTHQMCAVHFTYVNYASIKKKQPFSLFIWLEF